MDWRVIIRTTDGKIVQKEFEAENRKALFRVLTESDIVPIRIECLNREKKNKRNNTIDYSKILKIAGLLLIVLVFCILCCFTMLNSLFNSRQVVNFENKKEVKAISKDLSNNNDCKTNVTTLVIPPNRIESDRLYSTPTNITRKVVTNALGQVLVVERTIKLSGPMKNGESIAPRRIFNYDSEVAIDVLMNMDIGYKSLLILPPNMDQDFLNSLSSKIEFDANDTEDEIRRKKDMIEMKKELAKRVAAGEKVSQIAAETLAHYNKIANMRDTLLQEIHEMEKNGATDEEIEDVYEAANTMLKEYDALPIHSPKVRKAIIRERIERNKAKKSKLKTP